MNQNTSEAIKASWLSIFGNALLAIAKFVTGIFGNSYALIADAIESTTDVFSSFLVLLGLKYSSRPPDENHPYGHGKAEPLMTFAVVGFLVVSATVIAYESIQHIQTPHKVPEPYTLIVLGAIVIIKEYFYRKVSKKGDETKSTSLKADAWHHRSDAITSLMAFIGISIALFMGKGYETADDWAALFASGFIIYNAYLILRPALGEVMDEHMYDDMIGEIREVSINVPGVLDTEKCNVRKTGMIYHVDLHIIVNAEISVKEGHDIAHNVKNELLAHFPEIFDVLIHVEPNIEI
ncbi:cation diffusion facilitator family transporter [Salegentibacter mishustinae]|uniref:Cobalt-zinc-cadmium resistance protein n=1 Tax=Salegentibacter mishustinae TaxID=270918 RepID=A0A0Q9Z678_9FLAO|nr:cation diffusion facilitator family transporter [Salegentibacter mishustinae]KRG27353.1 cobalt-zinc-cadmium resistance protein [Salegentibacter mishustinae]PNW21587.1 cobalt-zinc-cadmium resistance protein [Salegentibacter mishustinae]PZX62458.1 cation diffusion facilitator family transporter [Salegentibacter mishustinae]GGW95996.1 cation transporter [Salegentibacter mishustinae]